jgi:hypothetical protein
VNTYCPLYIMYVSVVHQDVSITSKFAVKSSKLSFNIVHKYVRYNNYEPDWKFFNTFPVVKGCRPEDNLLSPSARCMFGLLTCFWIDYSWLPLRLSIAFIHANVDLRTHSLYEYIKCLHYYRCYAIYLLIFTNKRELCPIFFCAANNNCDEFIKLAINACMWGLPFYS